MKNLGIALLMLVMGMQVTGQINLTGVVKDRAGTLEGASIVLKNTTLGVSASENGRFAFKNLKKGNYTLSTSYLGYLTKEINLYLTTDTSVTIELYPLNMMTDEVFVHATRVKANSPYNWSSVSKNEIKERNSGQDIPYLLQLTPSFVATSDAGGGIGYSSFRIRGTDMNRINVTLNGIPLNDSESHGTWFVDLPDLASSLENVQVLRGVGTSTNGAASFGATINLQTNGLRNSPYAEYESSAGSFKTFKNSVSAGTGLIKGKFTTDVRLSSIKSDGYIDRAFSDLKSWFVSSGYYSNTLIVKLNVFSGNEITYQAWNGVPSDVLKTNRTYNPSGEYKDEKGNTNYYANETDNYRQTHYQAFLSAKINEKLTSNVALHYTNGSGYYENLKIGKKFASYQLPNSVIGGETIKKTDLIARKWLDNDFYGLTWSLNYKTRQNELIFGGGINHYSGDHFGKVIWAKYLNTMNINHEWYRNNGEKSEQNFFLKDNLQLTQKLNLMMDLQYRRINHDIKGTDDDLRDITQEHLFQFVNPKLGLFYKVNRRNEAFVSLSVANREPNRDNFVDADPKGKQPLPERLYDWETGFSHKGMNFTASAALFYMNYKNQLVLTGEINDVGAPIMVNVDKSYRSGVEIQTGWRINRKIEWHFNTTLSRNKIEDFTEYIDNWDTWGQENFHLGKTDLAFSPGFQFNNQIKILPYKGFGINLISTYVGKQYIDNSSNSDRMIDPWFVNNLGFTYSTETKLIKNIKFSLQVNNLFNAEYESNAWVYSYISEGIRKKMDGYFPQACRNYMFGLTLGF